MSELILDTIWCKTEQPDKVFNQAMMQEADYHKMLQVTNSLDYYQILLESDIDNSPMNKIVVAKHLSPEQRLDEHFETIYGLVALYNRESFEKIKKSANFGEYSQHVHGSILCTILEHSVFSEEHRKASELCNRLSKVKQLALDVNSSNVVMPNSSNLSRPPIPIRRPPGILSRFARRRPILPVSSSVAQR